MNRSHKLSYIFLLTFATVVGLAAICISPRDQAAANDNLPSSSSITDPKQLYTDRCGACHNLYDPAERALTRNEWQQTVNLMMTKYHASDEITPDEARRIVDYLATFAPKRPTNRAPLDPWATDQNDVWISPAAVSRVFSFSDSGSLSKLQPLSAGLTGPVVTSRIMTPTRQPSDSYARVSLPNPNPNRFGLLIDSDDTGADVDVQVRFQILHGQASPAVGIVVGYIDPQNYTVLRYDKHSGDLALIQVNGQQHTTLQKTVLEPEINASLQMPPALSGTGALTDWHTLRILVHNGKIHGWIDRNKRINVDGAPIIGGKVGLWSEGDTVAAFSSLTIDIYSSSSLPSSSPTS